MTKTLRTIEDLTPDAHNANRGTVRGRAMIEASIRECGAGRSIVVDREGRVIGGNKTLDVIEELGIPVQIVPTDGKTLVVVQRTDLDLESDPRARRLAYLDNRTTDVDLEWDAQAIAADLEAGFNFAGLFHDWEVSNIVLGPSEDKNDPSAEWQGMPEFENGAALGACHTIKVHFGSEDDIAKFAKLLGQTVTPATRYVWYPRREDEDLKQYRAHESS